MIIIYAIPRRLTIFETPTDRTVYFVILIYRRQRTTTVTWTVIITNNKRCVYLRGKAKLQWKRQCVTCRRILY